MDLLRTGCEIVDKSLYLSYLSFLTFTIKVIPQRAVERIKCMKSLVKTWSPLGEEEEEGDDASQGLRAPITVALWPWACSPSLAASSPICNMGEFKWVVAVEFLGFPGP